MKHPIQPLSKDESGVIRFKKNAIVAYLLDAGPFDMNQLALMPFSSEDREQFAQLIGYSLSGFGELSYVSDETYNAAELMANPGMTEDKARIYSLEKMLSEARIGVKRAAISLFKIHPDDLEDAE